MLSRIAAALCVLTFASTASAQDEDRDGVRRPERLTVGVADQLLGQLAPDHRTLYFVSNRNTTNEVFSQNVDDGKSHILFDDGGEVTWPRVSPDGKAILYISYAHLASGQLCIRDLPSGEDRRCTTSVTGAPLLAEWVDKDRIVFIERATIDGNLRVLEMKASGKLEGRMLFERNMTSPALSPDGKWLVYVPLERSSDRVGPAFAAHAARYLEAMRLDDPKTVVKIDPDLPGLTGQPAFSRDGKWIYFVQFFSDSNHDGFVDASDHGVLFRVPVGAGAGANSFAISGAAEQLTDESWNCQYPSPASDRLLMTCSRGRNLDLYTIPLEGEVPSDWDAARLQTEYLETGDLARAERAGTHYLVALELAGENLRYKAMVLGQLGILHTEVGNYRIALGYLEERVKLPYAENSEGMAVRLAMARSYLHAGNEGEAATKADEALELLNQGAPEFLQKYRPLVLDRAALYNLAANRFERAVKLYEEEMALPQPDPKNLFRVRLAHAAAALGAELPAKTVASLDEVDKALADDSHRAIPSWPHTDVKDVVRAYRLITAGLRARALQKLGQLDAAAKALAERKTLLASEKEKSDHGEYVRLLMLAEAQMADNAVQRKDAKTAAGEIGKALIHSDELHARAQGAIDTDQLDVILFAARTSIDKGEPISPDLAKRLETAHDELSKVPDAKLRTYRQWLEIYLAMAQPAP